MSEVELNKRLYVQLESIDKKLRFIRHFLWVCFAISVTGLLFGFFIIFSSIPYLFMFNKGYDNTSVITFSFIWLAVVLLILSINSSKGILSFSLLLVILLLEIVVSFVNLDNYLFNFPFVVFLIRMASFAFCVYGTSLSIKKQTIENIIYSQAS